MIKPLQTNYIPLQILCIIILIIYVIFISLYVSKSHRFFFINPIVQLILLLVGIISAIYIPFCAVLYLAAYIITYFTLYKKEIYETFKTVEDQVVNDVIDKNSLLANLNTNEEDEVEGVWSSSILGKEMGLNKG
jgi:hypothetical protein